DVALWDIKGKVANLPIHKLLGGTAERVPAYYTDGGWLQLSEKEMISANIAALERGFMGVKIKVGHDNPRDDIKRLAALRKELGDDVWIAADANQKWNYSDALIAGKGFQDLGLVWFEEPMICEDVYGHARLAAELRIPI